MDEREREELIRRFVREMEIRNFSRKTVESYAHSVRGFLEFMEFPLGRKLSEDTVKDYVQQRIAVRIPLPFPPA